MPRLTTSSGTSSRNLAMALSRSGSAASRQASRSLPECNLVDWLRDENRADGPRGQIGFAISARMSAALHEAIGKLAESAWEPYGKPHPELIRECAEVDFVPGEKSEKKDTQPLRYVAIRIRERQDTLFADGSKIKHFAVVSNIEKWKPSRLLERQREKAGTIEGVHDVLKNELAAGIMPTKYFGTNAAWLRLAVLTYNLLTALKRLALPAEYLTALPKRLRFLIFNTPGRLVHHTRAIVLRLATTAERLAVWLQGLSLLTLRV